MHYKVASIFCNHKCISDTFYGKINLHRMIEGNHKHSRVYNSIYEAVLYSKNRFISYLEILRNWYLVRKTRILLLLVCSLVIILIFITLQLLYLSGISCTHKSRFCFPQYILEMKHHTIKGKSLLSDILEGLTVLSYIAKDLSIYLNLDSTFVNIDYNDVIDTFSDHNLFKVGFRGYCRINQNLNLKSCFNNNGIDLFGNLIKDIGYQLGDTLGCDNPEEIAESLEIALAQMIANGIEIDPSMDEKDEKQLLILKCIKRIKLIKKFGSLLPFLFEFSFLISIISLFLVIAALIIFCFLENKKLIEEKITFIFHLVFHTTLLNLLTIITIILSEVYFHRKIRNFSVEIGFGTINFGIGFVFLLLTLITISISVVIIIFIIIKKPYKIYSQNRLV